MATKVKVLVTGSEGFIGQNLLPILGKKYDFNGIDITLGIDIFDKEIELFIERADVVIHLAALTSVEGSFKNPSEMFRVNVLGTARIAELCLKHKKKLVYPSTAAVYIPESSPYAYSKKVAEDIVRGVMDSIPVVILRFYNVFGPHMNPNSGSIMYNFLTSKKIVIYGDGEQTRDFIHVRDIVKIIKKSISNSWNGIIVDVGTGKSHTINYVAGLFSHYQKKKIEYKILRREIKWSIANTQMLEKMYKKSLTTNLEKDIKELCEKYQ